jgi:DNA-binding XRE family transcriptional regulator/predicted DNA-binding antitoxin AbrB/MazE fold protein
MSVAAKKPLIKIEIREGKKTKFYLVPKMMAQAVATLLEKIAEAKEDSILAEEVFPNLKDPSKYPMITFRGIRSKMGLTQNELAEKLKLAQADVSNIENGKRSIGKALAKRIEKEFKIDYRRFL